MTDSGGNDATTRADRVLGSLGSAGGRGVVRLEDRYDTDIDDLWAALTEPRRLARWYGEVSGEPQLGGRFDLYLESAGLRAVGRVEECEPPHRLRVVTRETDESWRQGEGPPPFDSSIEATLTADGDQTRLALEIRGLPWEALAFFGAGWQLHAENLAAYVTGGEPRGAEARWGALVPAYQALAATLDQLDQLDQPDQSDQPDQPDQPDPDRDPATEAGT